MAVFSYIATAIVASMTFITAGSFAATLATSIIAGGLAMGTAKVLGVFKPPAVGNAKDPGVKIQLPPATDNKIPVMYGRNFTGGIIIDAGISNQNKTMTYVLVLSEKTDSGTYTINDIYRDDTKLVFGSGASGHIVQSVIDSNATSTTNVNGKLRCRIYAGGTASSNQIFPATNKVASTTLLSTINGTTNYSGLVYAVFDIDYDQENNLVGLGAITFDITNSLSEPSNVLLDFAQNGRYGAGISSDDLDTTSFNDLYDYSTAQVAYTTSGGAGATHNRWSIDGMFGTYGNVKGTIDTMCQACSTFFTYNPKVGKFSVVPNRAATTSEKSAAFVFNDNNITGAITISSPELYSTINEIEAEFPLVAKKDQTDVVFISTPAGDRNANEPDNKLSTRYPVVNDFPRVHNLANIDLRQSRVSTVIEFDADYSAIQVDTGDVVKVTSSLYGYTNKLFRVMRVTEKESTQGMLTVNIVGLEYADSVYDHANVTSGSAVNLSGFTPWWINYGNANVTIGNVIIIDDITSNVANIINYGNGSIIGNIDLPNIANIDYTGITGPSIKFPITVPDLPGLDEFEIAVKNKTAEDNGSTVVFTPVLTVKPPLDLGVFNPGSIIDITIPTKDLGSNNMDNNFEPAINDYILKVKGRSSLTGTSTQEPESAPISILPKNYVNQTVTAPFAPGTQIEDRPANNVTVIDSSTANADLTNTNSIITPITNYDITRVEEGDYSIIGSTFPGGTISADYDVAFSVLGDVTYEAYHSNGTVQDSITNSFGLGDGSGIYLTNQGNFTTLVATNKISISNADAQTNANANATLTYLPKQSNIHLAGNSSMGTSVGSERGFYNNKYDILRITKGDRF